MRIFKESTWNYNHHKSTNLTVKNKYYHRIWRSLNSKNLYNHKQGGLNTIESPMLIESRLSTQSTSWAWASENAWTSSTITIVPSRTYSLPTMRLVGPTSSSTSSRTTMLNLSISKGRNCRTQEERRSLRPIRIRSTIFLQISITLSVLRIPSHLLNFSIKNRL